MTYEDFQFLKFEHRANGVLVITINRPEVMNATNARLHWELTKIWQVVHDDAKTKVAVITGSGDRAFSAGGDLANWHTGEANAIPAVGGAMDLALGAKKVYVMMEHQTKSGESKVVAQCSYPLTGVGCVNRIFTDLAVIDITPDGLLVREMIEGLELDELQRMTGAPLRYLPLA